MKDPFSLLKKAQQGETRRPPAELGLDAYVGRLLSEEKMVHVPADAFVALHSLPEYSYLKDGLYVSTDKLTMDKTVRLLLDGLTGREHDEDGKPLEHIDWYEAKEIASALGGKLLTPAEYFCVARWARSEKKYHLYFDMTLCGREWLDGIVVTDFNGNGRDSTLYTHTDVCSGQHSCGAGRKIASLKDGSFSLGLLDRITGFPKSLDLSEDLGYGAPAHNLDSVYRSCSEDSVWDLKTDIICSPPTREGGTYSPIGMRLCSIVKMDGVKGDGNGRR